MAKRQLTDRRALVTGASSGIGRALAIELARHGVDLVLLARREDRLAEVAKEVSAHGRRAVTIAGDVTDPAVRRRALNAARQELGGLDILVNNAGVAAHGRFADADPGRIRPIFEVNFFAPVELIREAIPVLREGVRPIVVNIGSILGERGAPHKSEYSASKFALHGFSEAVRPELNRLGIDVLVVAVGPTETEHFDVLLEGTAELPWGDPPRQPAEQVARAVVRAIECGRHKVATSWRARMLLLANRLFPRIVDRIMARFG
ncbi:MAG: SDR family NAD(P)-dependent oxidoreductase [Pirellulales bacterium]